MNYGLLTKTDVRVLEDCLSQLVEKFPNALRVAEIGVQAGNTARGIRDWCLAKGVPLYYTGFDNQRDMATPAPFDGATMVYGDSLETFGVELWPLSLLIIDGCHCVNHVMCDFLNFSNRVVPGGMVMFHDADATMQGRPEHYQRHGPRGNPSFSIGVVEAIHKLDLLNAGAPWTLISSEMEACNFGGFMVFRRCSTHFSATFAAQGGAR